MAKGGGKRAYVRDANGRFASTPGGRKPALQGGTLGKRTSLKKSRAKLKAKDKADQTLQNTLSTRAQKGAVTRGNKALRAAKVSSRKSLNVGKAAGTLGKTGKLKGTQVAKIKSPTAGLGKPRSTGKPGTVIPLTLPAKPQPQAGTKRKVTVQIKRAAPGGEYGSDGHFYSGGSWMPLGSFKGGAKVAAPGKGAAVTASQSKSGGQGTQERVIKQAKKERPRLDPGGTPTTIPGNLSKRGQKNIDDHYKNGYFKAYKKDKEGRLVLTTGGWLTTAADASRLTPKQTGAAIVRLRRMARDKKEFDAQLAWDRKLNRQPGAFGYEEARRGGYLPRGMTKNQYLRSSQLEQAIGLIANQRSKRQNNRRTTNEEYVWVKNNMLGARLSRTPVSAKAKSSEAGTSRIRRAAKIANTIRPVSTRKLIAAGGNLWQKGAHDRIYFNVSSSGKVFYDRNTRKMNVQGSDGVAALKREARKLQKEGQRIVPRRWKRGKTLNP